MKMILVTDALAAELVAKNEAEYVSEPVAVVVPHPDVAAVLPPVVAHSENGQRVDQPCPPGTPGTVTIANTGHTLSLPQVDKGEMFIGYCQRVWRQCVAASPNSVGALFQQSEFYFAPFGGFKADGSNWPQAADFFFNGRPMTDEEKKAQQANAHAFEDAMRREQQPQTPQPVKSDPQPVSGVVTPPVEIEVPVTQEQA